MTIAHIEAPRRFAQLSDANGGHEMLLVGSSYDQLKPRPGETIRLIEERAGHTAVIISGESLANPED